MLTQRRGGDEAMNGDLTIIDQAIDQMVDALLDSNASPEETTKASEDLGRAVQAEMMRRYSLRLVKQVMAKFRQVNQTMN